MRSMDAAEIAATEAALVSARVFAWIVARDRDTGDPVEYGFWTGFGTVSVDVVDAVTGATETRSFVGSGALLTVGSIRLSADIAVRTVDVDVSPIHPTVETMLRGSDVRNAPIQIYRGYLDPDSRALVAAPKARFVGTVDGAPITVPAEGGESSSRLRCVSTTRELTRTNPDVRSHESQQARHAGDDFYIDVAVVGDWDLSWGQKRGQVKKQVDSASWRSQRGPR